MLLTSTVEFRITNIGLSLESLYLPSLQQSRMELEWSESFSISVIMELTVLKSLLFLWKRVVPLGCSGIPDITMLNLLFNLLMSRTIGGEVWCESVSVEAVFTSSGRGSGITATNVGMVIE